MPFDPNIVQFLVLLSSSSMVLHVSEMAITLLIVSMTSQEIIFGEFQDDSEEHEQFGYDLVVDELPEFFDLRPIIFDKFRVRTLILWDEFGDVVNLSVVEVAWRDLTDTAGFVAVISSVFEVGAVLQFLFGGEIEELFAYGELMVYFFLGQTEVGNIKET